MSIAQNFPIISPSLLLDFANVQALDPRITFTRATTATYYGTETALAEQNLLLQSQTFDNASWAKTNVTVSANTTTAPDGTTTADTITENTATAAHLVQSGAVPYVRNTTFTISVYAKPNGKTQFLLGMTSGGGGQADFLIDLTAFTATFNFNNAGVTSFSGTATDVGSGWCRATITFTTPDSSAGDSGTAVFWLGNSKSYTGDGTSGLFLWGAQLEQRSAPTAYQVTTTQRVTNYIPVLLTAASGVARFDHNPTTFESLGLLIEEQRTNLFTYSDQFDNAAWTKSNATVTANTIISPDGTLDADKLVEGTATARKFVSQTGAASGRTLSVYAKAGGRNFIAIGQTNVGGLWGVSLFNLNTGAFVSTYQAGGVAVPTINTITSVGNGWFRVSCLLNAADATAIIMVGNGGDPIFEGYTGNGFDGIYIWGAQLEAASFATSYIPTVASQVTRAADSASMTGANFSSWFNQAQWTAYCEYIGNSSNPSANNQTIFSFGPNTYGGTNSVTALLGSSGIFTNANLSGTAVAITATPRSVAGKTVVSYSGTNLLSAVNGGTVATTTTAPSVGGLTTVLFGATVSNIQPVLNGTIKKFALYQQALSNTNLQALTT